MNDRTVKVSSWDEFKSRDLGESRKKKKSNRKTSRSHQPHESNPFHTPAIDVIATFGGPANFARVALACPEVVAIVSKELLARGLINKAFGRGIKTTRAGDFYQSKAWSTVRYAALMKHGARCHCCGATAADGATMHVDHIKPRSKFPDLALELSNLQVLCSLCNVAKSNIDQTDWSATLPAESGDYFEYMEEERRIVRMLRAIT